MKSTLLALIAVLIASTPLLAETGSSGWALNLDPDDGDRRTFATQAGLDWYREHRRIAAELQAEHLLATLHEASEDRGAEAGTHDDAVPVRVLTGPELEQIAEILADPRVIELLESSAYYAAIIEGRRSIID
jgi:hypothetical protein